MHLYKDFVGWFGDYVAVLSNKFEFFGLIYNIDFGMNCNWSILGWFGFGINKMNCHLCDFLMGEKGWFWFLGDWIEIQFVVFMIKWR